MRRDMLGIIVAVVIGNGFIANAQEPLMGIGYINTAYLFTLHPLYAEVQQLTDAASAEIGSVSETIQVLQEKQQLGTISPEESELLQANYATLQALQARYDSEIKAAAEPMRLAVDAAVREVASRLSIGMILDSSVAAEIGLVVYAASDNDLTALVAEQLMTSLPD